MILISGSQGVGKTTLINLLLKARPELRLSISSTTRKKREEEKDGEYDFLTEEEFNKRMLEDYFAESVFVHGHRYATPKKYFKDKVVLNVTASSIENFTSLIKNQQYITIFIEASTKVIRERLEKRKDLDIENKLKFSKNEEVYKKHFHYIINNENSIEESFPILLQIVDKYIDSLKTR